MYYNFIYPTNDSLEFSKEETLGQKQVLKAKCMRHRPINMESLNYSEQKEFFKLDTAYEQAFVQKH